MPTQEEMITAKIEENAAVQQARIDATQVTAEEKAARQMALRTQINAQHTATMALPVNSAKLDALRGD